VKIRKKLFRRNVTVYVLCAEVHHSGNASFLCLIDRPRPCAGLDKRAILEFLATHVRLLKQPALGLRAELLDHRPAERVQETQQQVKCDASKRGQSSSNLRTRCYIFRISGSHSDSYEWFFLLG
jgi:hypothetical protein